ncbi:tRNA lysidine(34) synthetase TilS [Mitsuaria sp. WAJ17]|uniref:tRNA lysidine(34) synthetase TilS n=1 Tax=Mitsuaria sp. WAJ17 TaxID=2761452 RepID=UPI0028734A64|nr:tRNA lysidine(34) synthetase TilS [Mitsuaria sp. WAJ17]
MAVAWSGGRDSTALMHATARCAQALAHEGFALRVLGLHVHHGLSPQADGWLTQLQRQVQAWAARGLSVELRWRRLNGSPAPGDSIEAWAREGRHAALQAMAQEAGATLLLLAHHRRDQAETWLLQALRGAGLAGLAAMPQKQAREGLVWARPWLDQPRERIEQYVQALGLDHVEDESNADPRFARNRLRLQLWPGLQSCFPGAEAALAQSARWAQEAGALLDEIADQDLRVWMKAPSGLDLKAWEVLSRPRLSNLLRHWLRDCLGRPAPASLVSRLLNEVGRAAHGAAWPAGDQVIQTHQGSLLALPARAPMLAWPADCRLDLSRPGLHACPAWRGRFQVDVADEPSSEAVGSSLLRNVILRPREGSEQFQRAPGTPARSLKKAWQAAGVPALGRGGPLVYADFPGETGPQARLMWVPALGLDARWRGQGEGPWLRLSWLPDAS